MIIEQPKTFTQACNDIIYPAYASAYLINQKDNKQTVINKLLSVLMSIQSNDYHLDIFARDLLNECVINYSILTNGNTVSRKELDKITNNILYKLTELLRAHNRSGDFGWIKNYAGKYNDHYTSK